MHTQKSLSLDIICSTKIKFSSCSLHLGTDNILIEISSIYLSILSKLIFTQNEVYCLFITTCILCLLKIKMLDVAPVCKKCNFDDNLHVHVHAQCTCSWYFAEKIKLSHWFSFSSNTVHSISKDCSAKCSFHGHCDKHENCVCDVGWAGLNCDIQTCISECVNGYCDNTTRLCVCESGFTGKKNAEKYMCTIVSRQIVLQASVIQRLSSTIHWKDRHSLEKC